MCLLCLSQARPSLSLTVFSAGLPPAPILCLCAVLPSLSYTSTASSPGLALLFCLHLFPIPPFAPGSRASFVHTRFPSSPKMISFLTQSPPSRTSLTPTLQTLQALSHQFFSYFCVPSFSADSESEKEQWLEAMQGAIAEALSTSEVAERIWAAAPNRFCADCGAPQPDWASINLCVVICKSCAGGCVRAQQAGHWTAGGLFGRSWSPYS